jgi:PAS domain S-box-containing protein
LGKIIRFGKRAVGIVAKPRAPTVKQNVAAFSADEHGQYVFVNSHWSKLTGLNQADALGRGWLASVHSDDREEVFQAWSDAIRGERFFGLTYRLNTSRESDCWVLSQAIPQHNDDGELSGYGGTILDLSQFPAIGSGPPSEPRLRMLLDLLGLCHYEHNLVTGEVTFSANCLAFLGGIHTVEEFDALLHPEDIEQVNVLFERSIAAGSLFQAEYRIAARDGTWTRVRDFAKIVYDAGGMPSYAVGFIAPVTSFLTKLAEDTSITLLCRLAI